MSEDKTQEFGAVKEDVHQHTIKAFEYLCLSIGERLDRVRNAIHDPPPVRDAGLNADLEEIANRVAGLQRRWGRIQGIEIAQGIQADKRFTRTKTEQRDG